MADDPPALEQHHCDAGANFVRIDRPKQTNPRAAPLCGQSVGLLTAFPQSKKTPAALVSGDCCPGNPNVKWFALERSPNFSHPILSRENQDRFIRVKIIPVTTPPTQPRLSHNGR